VLGDEEVIASDVIYWRGRAVDAEKRAARSTLAASAYTTARPTTLTTI